MDRIFNIFGSALIVILSGSPVLFAQDAAPAEVALPDLSTLDLAQCQEIARNRNRGLQMARNNLASALAGERIAEADVFAPRLNVSQAFTEETDRGEARAEIDYLSPLGVEISPFVTESSNSENEEEWSSNVGITLRRRLFSAAERWRLRQPLTSAERNLLQAQNNLRLQERELDFNVMRSFLAVQRVKNRLQVREDRLTDANQFLKITEERVANGLAPRVDIVNSEINLNQAEADLLSEQTNLRNQTETLLNVIGLTVTNALEVLPYDLASIGDEPLDLESDSINLMTRHENLVNAKLNIEFAKVDLRIQRDLLRPQVDISFTAEHQSEGADLFNDAEEDADAFRLLLSYSTTLDFKKRDRARVKQLELGLANLETGYKDTEHGLLLNIRSLHRNLARLKTQVGLNEKRLEAEKAKLEATLVRYEDGDVDNLEVTRAKQTVVDAEINLINTNIERVLAQEEYKSSLPPKQDVQTELTPP